MNDEVSVEIDDSMLEIMAAEDVLAEKAAPVAVMVPVSKDERETITWAYAEGGRWQIESITIDVEFRQHRIALLKAAPDVRARAVPCLMELIRAVAYETARVFQGAAKA